MTMFHIDPPDLHIVQQNKIKVKYKSFQPNLISNFIFLLTIKISNTSLWTKKKSESNYVPWIHFQLWHPDSCSADLTLIYSDTVAKPVSYLFQYCCEKQYLNKKCSTHIIWHACHIL